MPCYFPLTAYRRRDYKTEKGAKIVFKLSDANLPGELTLPCGQCVGCRLEKSRQWAVRCVHEASLYEQNSFLTLTYNDEYIPKDGSLDLVHFQKFMKRLRKEFGSKIRYYHCGEYGDLNGRPHYHALLFNFFPPDCKYFKGEGDKKLFTSNSLSRLWPMGHSIVGAVTFESAAYVARYVMKKVTGDRAAEHYQGRKPEYTTMSRRPGIGKGWYEKFKTDVYPIDRLVVRGVDTRPPRFYDNLFSREDRSAYELLKIEREKKNGNHYVQDTLSDGKIVNVSDSSSARLAVKEIVKLAEISNLERKL